MKMQMRPLWMMEEDELVGAFTALMEKTEDFAEVKSAYTDAVRMLKGAMPEQAEKLDAMVRAGDRLIYCGALFAGTLGFQANLEHFKNPSARTFLEVGIDRCLRESTMRGMDDYFAAYQEIGNAWRLISEELGESTEPLYDYISYLEMTVPKLAHYLGFLAADDLLRYTEPGYHCDTVLTHAYQRWIKEYFGTDFFKN